ncbi:MAG: O-antigen ligase family protein [Patescibacteria group bacterium]
MPIKLKKLTTLLALCACVIASVAFFIVRSPAIAPYLTIVSVLSIFPLLFLYPTPSFFVLLIARNIVDVVSDIPLISIGGMSLNLAALMGIFFIIWGAWYVIQHWPIKLSRTFIIFLLFLLVSAASVLTSLDPVRSAQELIKFINLAFIYVIAFHICNASPAYAKLIAIFAYAIIIPAMLGLLQLIRGTGLNIDVQDRLYGTYVHPNSFAFALVIGIFSCMIARLLLSLRKNGDRADREKSLTFPASLRFDVLMAILGVLLLFTYTRSAWIGAVIILSIYFLRFHTKTIIISGLVMSAIIFSFPIFSRAFYNTTGYDISQIALIQRMQPPSGDDATDSFTWRIRSWKEVSVKLHGMPLFGYGPAMYTIVRESTVRYLTDLGIEAHNDYLRLALETGWLGVFFYFLFFAGNIFQFIQAVRNIRTRFYEKIFTVAAAMSVAFMVMSVSDNILRSTPVSWLLWAFMGGTIGFKQSLNSVATSSYGPP